MSKRKKLENNEITQIYLAEEIPEDLIIEIGRYLVSNEIDAYPDRLVCRLTDKSKGYYIVCCKHQDEYEKDPQKYDSMSDLSFKMDCEGLRVIIQTGKYPKHNNRFFANNAHLSFEQYYNVIEMLKDYVIKETITIPNNHSEPRK